MILMTIIFVLFTIVLGVTALGLQAFAKFMVE